MTHRTHVPQELTDLTVTHRAEWTCPTCHGRNRREHSWPQAGDVVNCERCNAGFRVHRTPE